MVAPLAAVAAAAVAAEYYYSSAGRLAAVNSFVPVPTLPIDVAHSVNSAFLGAGVAT